MGINAKTIREELTEALGPDIASYATVQRCPKRFCGRPVSILTGENIEPVRQVIEDHRHSTYDNIIAETSLSHGTIERIIHDCLKMR